MPVLLNRRTMLTTGTAGLLLPMPARASDSGTRSFRVTRDGSDIGTHRLTVTRNGDTITGQTQVDIAVKILGITAYRYELAYTEVYQNGLLQSLEGTSNDDGEQGYVKAVRSGDTLTIDGSTYSGPAPTGAVPTSYWQMSSLNEASRISPQSGLLMSVTSTEIAPLPQTPAGSRAWRTTDNDEYTVDIWYDEAGDWTGCSFDAQGALGVYTLDPGSASLVGFAA